MLVYKWFINGKEIRGRDFPLFAYHFFIKLKNIEDGGTMKDTIVFHIDVDDEESYALLANFIYKREHHMNLSQDEMRHVTYKYYFNNSYKEFKHWICRISLDKTTYQSVNQPKKIKNITDKYEIIYCVKVNESSDIVELHNLFLIKHYYAELKILILFEDYSMANYHKISQFLYQITSHDANFYASCFFVNQGKEMRMQLNNIQQSRSFIPLQIVDQENLMRLFGNCKDVLSEKYLRKVLNNREIKEDLGEKGELVEGGIKVLRDIQKQLSVIPDEQVIQILHELDIFAFNLLCYVISVKQKEIFDSLLLEHYAFQMQQYSMAIRQLAENIVFHSKTGFGVIAVRVHRQNSLYVKRKYQVSGKGKERIFVEVIVSDFCGNNLSGNIAENFIANLEDEEDRKIFNGLKPNSFFEHEKNEEAADAWEHFYRKPDNIGKHYGLRIFQSVVSTFEGFFGAESHSGYISQSGDSFSTYRNEGSEICMPGTRYHILIPLEIIQTVIRKQDLSLDSGINIGKLVNNVMGYHIGDMSINQISSTFLSQKHKDRQIVELADYIYSYLKKNVYDIVYISMEKIEESRGEILTKALLMALYRLKREISVVLYQCSDYLKKSMFEALRIFFKSVSIEEMFYKWKVQIAFYSKEFEELIVDLGNESNTDNINAYIANMKCITSTEWYFNQNKKRYDLNKGAESYIPYDILHEIEINNEKRTIFEHYTANILNQSIQTPDFGCKLEHTHMRLGSTIHIDEFYEAEILFENKLFVSRFALLLVKDMKDSLKGVNKLTLYGYGTYSETVLVQMIDMIYGLYPKEIDVDYIILEREEEKRGFLHKDKIRYNRLFQSEEDRIDYFKDRKVATIVLINSTLKTHLRLISLFKEENKKDESDENWLLSNYAVLLIGNAAENRYWTLKDKKVKLVNGTINPTPRYFVHAHANYQEPSECVYCFPKNPLAEIPLIEVNAASTIPNQGFGIIKEVKDLKLTYQLIKEEEDKFKCLKDKFIYGHIQRNENHFLYYFKTENMWMCEKERIRDSLHVWKQEWKREERLQYNIIVAPMHFSNAGFVELVNQEVFGGNAILLRIDFDKEYRCNAYTKFSYLRNYVEQLYNKDKKGIIRVHFVDDAIISGRTYHRAKSVVESVLGIDQNLHKLEIKVFDKVFVIIDRNSIHSRRQYVKNCNTDFYAFIHINISSLRNYGDSCIFCNLKNEAELLYSTASTKQIAEYWMHCIQKFKLYPLEEYNNKPLKDSDRAFRRLFCTHMAQSILEEKNHGNNHEQAIYLILRLLCKDYEGRKKENSTDRYEYFLSYLKCISRPFLVFRRAVKEAIFDILLLFIEAVVQEKSLRDVIKTVEGEKKYLKQRRLILLFNWIDKNILNDATLSEKNKQDLVRLLMKQLTELKSNYVIRPDKMEAIFRFMDGTTAEKKKFENYYMTLIDRLVSSSSDTNKSIWLDQKIFNNEFHYVTEDYRVWVILENTRAFRDGIEKLYIMASKEFRQISRERIDNLKKRYDYHRAYSMFEDFHNKNAAELETYKAATEDLERENIYEIKERIQRFVKTLPKIQSIDFRKTAYSLELGDKNWSKIFYFEKEMLKEEIDENDESAICEQLKRLINQECDSYQYGNFYKILNQDGYMDGKEISSDGADMIACCMKILNLCRQSDTKVLDKVQELAALFKIILRADKVQFIIENEDNNNLDEWKGNIEDRYNKIVKQYGNGNLPELHIRGKKHYTVIVEKANNEDCNTDLSQEVETLLSDMLQCEEKMHNYRISKKHGIVIWKFENSQRSIWINIENKSWRGDEEGLELRIARDMRRVMVFYQELKEKIFNAENDDFLNEISRIRKELRIYNSNKVYTHTKDYQQEMQFEHAVRYFMEGNEQEILQDNYASYVLNLLADINVSKYYRDGLHKKMYKYEKKMENYAIWQNLSAVLGNHKTFVYRESDDEKVSVRLEVLQIDGESHILCEDNSRSIQELTLLIYSLILNAAEQGRGMRKIQKKISNSVQKEQKCVIVKLYKEGGCLIIENECEESVHPDQIERYQDHVPESEEDGISFWSFNCYIKQCINSLILSKMKEIEENIQKGDIDSEKIQILGRWIEKLAGRECEIQSECYMENNKNYFRVKIPIFIEKYRINI